MARDRSRNETGPLRVDVSVPVSPLSVDVEALRHHEMELIFRARHGDVKEPAFFFDLLAGSDAQVRRDAAVDGIQHEYGFPFLALRRMDRREDEVVLIEKRRSRLVARRAGWVERELG